MKKKIEQPVKVDDNKELSYLNFIGMFFGPDKISKVESIDEKTYLGKLKVKIYFDGDKQESLPLEVLQEVAKAEATDLNALRENRVKPVVEKILALLVESELTLEYQNYAINTKLLQSVQDAIDRASHKLWGKKNYELTLFDVEQILKK